MEKSVKILDHRATSHQRKGFHTVTPFIVADNASELIKFINQAFGAKTTSMVKMEDGKIMHATVKIGDSEIMIAETMEGMIAIQSQLYLYVTDVDHVYESAVKAGGESVREPTDEFYGDRSAGIKDAWGNHWWVATHMEDVSDEEIKVRAKKFQEEAANR